MQGLMLILEIVVVALIAIEVYIRFTGRRKGKKLVREPEPPPVSTEAGQVASAPVPTTPRAVQGQVVQEEALSGEDLLREADIYMQYGHYSQAATVLRWYVDLQPGDGRAINQLLDAYLALEELNAYAQLLDSLGEAGAAPGDQAWWKQRVGEGLRRDPGNLELLVLAEKMGMPIPSPEAELQEPMTAAKALALVSRNSDPQYGIAILHAAILEEPLRLPLYAELLRITHNQRDIERYINALILMNLALGDGGGSIRERMLRAGMNLGPHPLWERLAVDGRDPAALRRFASERNLKLSTKLPE
ncbi:hypothetical protein AB4090_01975 [Acidithiobacillus sp. IBUN Pt1247-S3]|uniref:hypothetical protein n=1 Tax=Acidithiobacillus sp. IBUN Pt1247-S3 TaxID=3166642 RepID=UPI0034E38859